MCVCVRVYVFFKIKYFCKSMCILKPIYHAAISPHLPGSPVLIRCPWPATVASNGRDGCSPKRFTDRRSMAHKLLDTETRAALNKRTGGSGHATPLQLMKLMT